MKTRPFLYYRKQKQSWNNKYCIADSNDVKKNKKGEELLSTWA